MLPRCAARRRWLRPRRISLAPFPAPAQENRPPPTIRDAEIEQLLRDYTQPILRAAGLAKQNVQVVIINEASFNAFVVDGRRIFVNSGALMESATPNQIIGVLAHEAGHIAGGHLAKLREQLARAQTQTILATILGVGAVVAGATTNRGNSNNGLGSAGAAALSAPQEVIRRNLLSYQRQQEEAADRAGVRYLNETAQSPKGMYETFKRMSEQLLFLARNADPYAQSHPMPAERVAALADFARTSPYWDKKDDTALQLRHDLMRAKISGFMERPDTVLRRYPMSNDSLPARYARAIAGYKHGDLRNAIAQIDALLQVQPNNPYFYELRGQALLEGARPNEAIAPLRRALQLSNNSPLIAMMLGQALVASNNAAYADEAINILKYCACARTGSADRLHAAGDGLWPQGQLCGGRSCVCASRLPARRHEDGARSRLTRQDALCGRLARLGQGRRHCEHETDGKTLGWPRTCAVPADPCRKSRIV